MGRYIFTDAAMGLMERSMIPFAIYQYIDKRVVTIVLSEGFCRLFGYDDRALAYFDMDNDMYKNTHPNDVARISDAAVDFAKSSDGKYEVIYRSKKPGGDEYFIVHAIGEHIVTDEGVRLAQVWYTDEGTYAENNIDHKLELGKSLQNALFEESAIRTAYYDHLTGLPAMTLFFDMTELKAGQMYADGESPVILYMDFSGMKYYNRKYGFAEGDKLLHAFARVMSDYFGSDSCSRFGQDHFAAITGGDGLETRLKEFFEHCKELNGGITLPVHVGVYFYSIERVPISTACDRAKLACDSLKNRYSSEFAFFDNTMIDRDDNRQYIINNLSRALEERWIDVYYQPIVRAVNGRVCDEEALARWVDPVKGILSPSEFIPVLEELNLIYRLDLYVLDRVIEKLRIQKDAGLHLVPQSINLSRSDFDSCDIVEEICRRVDAADLSRSLFTIEITESMIGRDFDFIKDRVLEFKCRGFSVWMDDFGSGYSSLDALQSIEFDLIKFDMRFMQEFDDSENTRIILTELMKMAAYLGIDTVCEGVETEAQVQFLREIGCSKLQGFYYTKPIPLSAVLERYEKGIQIGFENPEESQYYEMIGRVNLHDLSVVTQGGENDFQKYFNNLPMAILEMDGDKVRYVRSNQSYRDYLKRYYDFEITESAIGLSDAFKRFGLGEAFRSAIRQTCEDGRSTFVDEKLPDHSNVHAFVRMISKNQVNGKLAIAIAILAISDSESVTTKKMRDQLLQAQAIYQRVMSLLDDYVCIYTVDVDSDRFFEYNAKKDYKKLGIEKHGEDFFGVSTRNMEKHIYAGDIDRMRECFTKDNILSTIRADGEYNIEYGLLLEGRVVPVHLKATLVEEMGGDKIVIGIRRLMGKG